ncbi:MAG: tRNA-uridine aminocarboxypropyltransferase [Myxococcota bacterium]|nr:tRNA-uridine aminocarboxypropyltransferase [Myxococcota bacterium]
MKRDLTVNRLERCLDCGLHRPLCICDQVQVQTCETKVTVLMHAKESRRSTNSGHLVRLMLSNYTLRLRGDPNMPRHQDGLLDCHAHNVVLFPDEDAEVLDQTWVGKQDKPINLIVPDGNWRQAKRMTYRERDLADLPKVKLKLGPPSTYRLRRHTNPQCVSTFEAIMRALRLLESDTLVDQLDHCFRLFVERSLWARGDLERDAVYGGIPDPALKPFR